MDTRDEVAVGPRPEHRLRVAVPADWNRAELPGEEPDFSQPAAFHPLLVCLAPYAPVVVSVSIRPAYPEGELADHAARLCAGEGFTDLALRPAATAGRDGVACDAMQATDAGPLRIRIRFFRDGGTLWQLGVMAPAPIWPSVEAALDGVIASAELAPERATEAIDLALAPDAGTLDPEHELNVRMRDQGAGLVPRVLQSDPERKCATVGAGAIEATFSIPFGWHVIDDGRRTLVFDAEGRIQVNLDARSIERRDPALVFQPILEDLRKGSPDLEARGLDLLGLPCLAVRNLKIDGELLEQAYLLCDGSRDGLAIVTRVTAPSEHMGRAMDLAEVILRSLSVARG